MIKMDNEMLKSSMYHGAMVGAGIIIFSILAFVFGYDEFSPNEKFNFLSLIPYFIIIFGIILGQKNFRDKILDGKITYGKSVGYGVLVAIFASILHSFYLIIFLKYIEPATLQLIFDITEQNFINSGMSSTEIKEVMTLSKKFILPSLIFGIAINYGIFGLIISLFSSIKIKNVKVNSFDEQMKNID